MRRALVVGMMVAAMVGCREDVVPTAAATPESVAEDGMCTEHGVLEALCTKCNPALAPVFQQKGDWCAEHALPESICPICHPERGGRPIAQLDLDEDSAPVDGIRVRLASVEVALVAGLRTAAVEAARPGREVGAITTIQYDATRLARINPRAEGIINAFHAELGSVVEPGTVLAEIESAAVGQGKARIASVRSQLRLARRQLARAEQLMKMGATSVRAVDEARGAVHSAEGDLAALTAQQTLLGPNAGSTYQLESPIAGVVTRRAASIGAYVDTEDLLFEIVDTSVMWAEIDVAEADMGAVAEGLEVTVTVPTLGQRTFDGRVAQVAREVDRHSRTVRVRVPLDNADGALRANMFAHARFRAPGAGPERGEADHARRPRWLVPQSAIQAAKDVFMVFVELEPDVYEGRRVVVGRAERNGLVAVEGRLSAGDRVVDRGAFILKTETLKDSIGAGCCADEGER